ncbi:class F sortase [Knoellia locipacati]|uniref:class F sortase n=1 Tax=Knoellia locipacati TaxID=882824 RepID=UPI0038502530
MSSDRTSRSRRLTVSAAAAMAFGVLGVAATGYALSQQVGAPPKAVTDASDHSGHGGADPTGSTSPSPSTTPGVTADPHAGHGGTAPAGDTAYRTPKGPLLARSRPTTVTLPGQGKSAPVIDLSLKKDGRMEVPDNGTDAGWFTSSPTPGELGPAVIAAHVTHRSKPAVFFELSGMARGDRIEVTREDGSTATFAVTSVGQYPKADFPTEKVYGSVDHAALRLITCGGVLDGETGSHVDNVVVYADLVA